MTLLRPTDPDQLPGHGTFIAGGTDLGERIRHGEVPETLVDITRLPGMGEIAFQDGAATLGALCTIHQVGAHPGVARRFPALASVCRTLATPQTRYRATLGGVLCQRTRCWYYRHGGFACYKRGGSSCAARGGNNLYGVAFDRGPCVYPHPSSVALALHAYDTTVTTNHRATVTLADLFGDGSDPTRDHHLAPGELLTAVHLPDPGAEDPAAYARLMSREWAEWPLVEAVVRLRVEGGRITLARVVLGAVANIPLRLPRVEAHLTGAAPGPDTWEVAATRALEGATALPGAQDKRALIRATLLEAFEKAAGAPGAT